MKKISFFLYNFIYAIFTLTALNFYVVRYLFQTLPVLPFIGVLCVLFFVLMTVLSILFWKKTTKPVSVFLLLANAVASYFIVTYEVALNKLMLSNLFDTNIYETTEWLGVSFWLYVLLLGFVPSFLVIKANVVFPTVKKRFKQIVFYLILAGLISLAFLPHKTAVSIYLKENFALRYQLVPSGYLSSFVSMAKYHLKKVPSIDSVKGLTHEKYWKTDKKNLIVFVLGESARDASFSLSGYDRDTASPLHPYLDDMTVFKHTESCGVLTRVSLPCMFTAYRRHNYDERGISYTTNALDILQNVGFDLLWLDNEMGCNKMCRNIPTEFTCDSRDCTDEKLNAVFKDKMAGFDKDTFVVLHQRGSHGPRYDLRVPDDMRLYQPFCRDANHKNCTYQELVNAYDNTMYYTSYVVADLIDFLSHKTDKYNPILIFISDHGESLGEENFWGHGGDFDKVPNYQKEVPFFVWMPPQTREALGLDKECLDQKIKNRHTQDYIFHSLLGLGGVRTDVYDETLDIFSSCLIK